MEKDPILEELHQIREEYAARFNHDLRAIYRDMKTREEAGEFVVVRRAPRSPRVKVPPRKRAVARGAA